MGIPFIPMDASNTINGIVNDAIGIKPTAPEPAGPIDITDQCSIVSPAVWGSGGSCNIRIPGTDYIEHYFEVITKWPGSVSITGFGHWNVTETSDEYASDNQEVTTKCYYPQPGISVDNLDIGIQITAGSGLSNNPELISVKVSETEF